MKLLILTVLERGYRLKNTSIRLLEPVGAHTNNTWLVSIYNPRAHTGRDQSGALFVFLVQTAVQKTQLGLWPAQIMADDTKRLRQQSRWPAGRWLCFWWIIEPCGAFNTSLASLSSQQVKRPRRHVAGVWKRQTQRRVASKQCSRGVLKSSRQENDWLSRPKQPRSVPWNASTIDPERFIHQWSSSQRRINVPV